VSSVVERIASGRTLDITSRAAARAIPWRRGALVTLTYHRLRVEGNDDLHPGLATVDPELFARQMAEVARRWNPVSLSQVLDATRGGSALPPRSVLVTFDDGYRDFGEVAWPVMADLGIRPVLFVATGHASDPSRWFWWDRLHRALGDRSESRFRSLATQVKALGHAEAMALVDDIERSSGMGPPRRRVVHNWSELVWLEAQGVDIAPHTVSHPLLHRSPASLAAEELRGSWAEVRRNLGRSLPVFAYPDGGFDAAVLALVEATGFELAFTTVRGGGRPGWGDPLTVPRVNVGRRTDLSLLRAQLAVFGGAPQHKQAQAGPRVPIYARNRD